MLEFTTLAQSGERLLQADREETMDAFGGLLAVLGVVGSLILFDVIALRYGVDSRDPFDDSHARASYPRGWFPFWR